MFHITLSLGQLVQCSLLVHFVDAGLETSHTGNYDCLAMAVPNLLSNSMWYRIIKCFCRGDLRQHVPRMMIDNRQERTAQYLLSFPISFYRSVCSVWCPNPCLLWFVLDSYNRVWSPRAPRVRDPLSVSRSAERDLLRLLSNYFHQFQWSTRQGAVG